MTAYYNENDSEKAAWIRELIQRGIVAPGDVDERSITEVRADDLRGYKQCHFFAGIAVWSYALRLAGWPDDREVWTGSCPCPSFSAAGKGQGFDDPRHLWPDWYRLIPERLPPTIFGEQSDDAIDFGWIDLVQADLEKANYAVGKAVLATAGVGGPCPRERLYFVGKLAGADNDGHRTANTVAPEQNGNWTPDRIPKRDGDTHRMDDSDREGPQPRSEAAERDGHGSSDVTTGGIVRMGEPIRTGLEGHDGHVDDWNEPRWFGAHPERPTSETSILNGFWRDADWVLRKKWNSPDSEWCPTEPGSFPLVAGAPARVLRLRGYGDAINAEVAKAFIEAGIVACCGEMENVKK